MRSIDPQTVVKDGAQIQMLVNVADDEMDAKRFASAQELARRAYDHANDLFGAPTSLAASALALLGMAHLRDGATADADVALEQVTRIASNVEEARLPAALLGSEIALAAGAYAEADERAREAIALLEKEDGLGWPVYAMLLRTRGRAALGLGDRESAMLLLAKSAGLARTHFGPGHPAIIENERELLDLAPKHPYR
jgi:tetratricopeptide (TPR) repeat protein